MFSLQEDFKSFLLDVTKEPEPFERSEETEIQAALQRGGAPDRTDCSFSAVQVLTEALLDRVKELGRLAPEMAEMKAGTWLGVAQLVASITIKNSD